MPEQIPFSDLAQVNPPATRSLPAPDCEVSFIPMQDVTDSGAWAHRQTKKISSIGNGYTAFQEGDVLFAKITPCMENGKGTHAIGLVNGVGFGSTEFHVLRAKGEYSSRFIFHWCNSTELRQAAEVLMTGSAGQKRVPVEFFSKFLVTRIGENEQHAIADILDNVNDAIRCTEAVIAKLRLMKAGMLHDLLTRGIDENGELRDSLRHPEQFKDSPLGRIPKEWNVDILGHHILLISGQHIEAKFCSGNPKYIPYLTGPTDFPEGKIVVSKYTAFPKVLCQPGDILITVKGSGVGKTVIADSNYCISRQLMAVRGETFFPQYLYYMLVSFAECLRTEASGLIPGISRADLLDKKIVYPPLVEQRRIAYKLDSFDIRKEQEEKTLVKLTIIKQALMQDLLTGWVRVPEKLLEAMP